MKNSTVLLVFGILGLGGVGAYLYLKNKKNSVVSSLPTSTTTTTPTSGTSSVADDTLGLSPKPTSLIDETKTNNYIIAKNLSEEIADLQKKIKSLSINFNKKYPHLDKTFMELDIHQNMEKRRLQSKEITLPMMIMTRDMQTKSTEANALGYKILPYGLIEKM